MLPGSDKISMLELTPNGFFQLPTRVQAGELAYREEELFLQESLLKFRRWHGFVALVEIVCLWLQHSRGQVEHRLCVNVRYLAVVINDLDLVG